MFLFLEDLPERYHNLLYIKPAFVYSGYRLYNTTF